MSGFKCGVCGQVHDKLPMDLSYQRPAAYFKVPAREREKRIKWNVDLCTIDARAFYIRGVLPLPLREGSDEFRWGIWAKVAKQDFYRYLELWDADISPDEPPLQGRLSGGVRDYKRSDGLAVQIFLQSNGQRPLFKVVDADHPLGRDQRQGITMQHVHEFLAPFLGDKQ